TKQIMQVQFKLNLHLWQAVQMVPLRDTFALVGEPPEPPEAVGKGRLFGDFPTASSLFYLA
ncbi:hypothetical protein, partial [Enterococcus avium]|uniref:hypothetical protein n=1 Tax=Enterococcus avium TaxID=33945 RepID=UPI0028907071